MANGPEFDPVRLFSHKFPERTYSYTERDAALYALGVGACASDALDEADLKYVHHQNGLQFIQVLPTFATLFPLDVMSDISGLPGLPFDPRLLLHGEQYVEICRPLPSSGSVQNKASIVGLHDKGKAAILEIGIESYEQASGELLCKNRMTVFLRGAGGFSKSSHPYSFAKYRTDQVAAPEIPRSQPFFVHEDCINPSQALLYRLSGDYNPLHSDPTFAKKAGFPRPILHGLCTLGFAIRAVIKCTCNGYPNKIKTLSGRFLLHVYPGETLITKMWLDGSRVIYQSAAKERNKTVLSGFVQLDHPASSL